ncbi:DUF2268 domain-containing protein [Nigerium massiliense]|uniref:DUF2268 domain-containing protein n=1 Tax=Nigerium massiliense TaxID=1522317 RepID=UPI00058F6BDA|nr:DUF2268 domain-containing putative Zn-dependent protease [Nigerium massiliense]
MTISIIDSAAAMRQVLDAPPSVRAEAVRELWAPLAGMYHFIPGGVDLAEVHRQSFGFPFEGTDAVDARLRVGLDALEGARVWQRARQALDDSIAALTAAVPGLAVPDLRLLLLLGDPTSDHFMTEIQGLSAFGGISGFIAITIWPHPQVLDRLEALVAHELHHNVRYSPGGVIWDPATVTVGEHVVAEGLADTFASELYGPVGATHFVSERTRTDDAVLAKVASGLGVTGMADFTAWVLGDASARLFGGRPVGLPTGAGYAAGARLVRAYLEETGSTAAAAVHAPAADVLDVALPRLGLVPGSAD